MTRFSQLLEKYRTMYLKFAKDNNPAITEEIFHQKYTELMEQAGKPNVRITMLEFGDLVEDWVKDYKG